MKRFFWIVLLILGLTLTGMVFAQLPEGWEIQQIDDHGPYEDMAGFGLVLKIDADLNPHIVYRNLSSELMYAFWTGAEWNIEKVIIPGITSTYMYTFTMDLDTESRPHIFFVVSMGTNQGYYSKWNGTSWEPAQLVDPDAIGWIAQIILDSADNPHIVYYARRTGCYATLTPSGWQTKDFAEFNVYGRNNSIGLDSEGQPHIAAGGHDGMLHYMALTEQGWTHHTIGFMGYYSGCNNIALTLDFEDYVHIAYIYRPTPEVRYAKGRGDVWNIQNGLDLLIDPNYLLPTIDLDPNQNPHISYSYFCHPYPPADWEARYMYWDGAAWNKEIIGHCDDTCIQVDPLGNVHYGYLNRGWPNSEYEAYFGEAGLWYAVKRNSIAATIDLTPKTLTLKSKGKWITCYIELPQGFDVNDIDPETVLISQIGELGVSIIALEEPVSVGDKDEDGVPDLMVKFDRLSLASFLELNDLGGEVEFTVTGCAGVAMFEGIGIINILQLNIKKEFTDGSSGSLPVEFMLYMNHPNPFNPCTTIEYALPEARQITLEVYNIAGKKVRTLVNGTMQAGRQTVIWDGRNDMGQAVSCGVYLCRFHAQTFTKTIRMVYLK